MAASAALLLAALASTAAGDNSCFEKYKISRLFKTKYDVCSEANGYKACEHTNVLSYTCYFCQIVPSNRYSLAS